MRAISLKESIKVSGGMEGAPWTRNGIPLYGVQTFDDGTTMRFNANGDVTGFTDTTGASFAVSYDGNGSTCVTVAWGLGGAVAGSIAALTGAIAAIFGGAIGNMLGNEMSNACNGNSAAGSGRLLELTPFMI